MKKLSCILSLALASIVVADVGTGSAKALVSEYIGCFSSCEDAESAAMSFCSSYPGSFYAISCGGGYYYFRRDVDLGPEGYAEVNPNCAANK